MSRYHDRTTRKDRARWEYTRRAAFERDGWRCTRCGKAGRLEAHHEPPLERGGHPFALAGIVTLCRSCHISRHCTGIGAARAAWRRFLWEPIPS